MSINDTNHVISFQFMTVFVVGVDLETTLTTSVMVATPSDATTEPRESSDRATLVDGHHTEASVRSSAAIMSAGQNLFFSYLFLTLSNFLSISLSL